MGGAASKQKKYEKNEEEVPKVEKEAIEKPASDTDNQTKVQNKISLQKDIVEVPKETEDTYSSKVMEMVKGSSLFMNYTQFEVGRLCIFFENLCDDDDAELMSKGAFFGLFPEFTASVSSVNTKYHELQMKTLDKIFSTFDENKDDKLNLKEFLDGFSYWHNSVSNFQDTLLVYFKLFDTDKKGLMDIDGFRAMIEHMVIAEASKMQRKWAETNKHVVKEKENLSKDIDTLVELVFNDVDEDGSGEIDFNEFKSWVDGHTAQAMMLGDDPETLIKSFRLFDIDGSGTISKEEFAEMLQSTHHGDTNLQDMSGICSRIDNFAKNVFKVVDEDNSGEIEFVEFAQWVKDNKGRTETISEAGETLAEITGLLKKAANVMQKERKGKGKSKNDGYSRMGSLEKIQLKPKRKQRPSVSDVIETIEPNAEANA